MKGGDGANESNHYQVLTDDNNSSQANILHD